MQDDHNPARYISRYTSLRIVVNSTYTKEVNGRIVTVPGKDIRFVEGIFETTDPELVDFLEGDKKSFGTVYIRVQDNVKDVVKDRGEWMKDLETKERELKEREEALKAKEAKINASEEGSKQSDGLLPNTPKVDLIKIATDEGVTGVTMETKNKEIIEAIRKNRIEKANKVDGGNGPAY